MRIIVYGGLYMGPHIKGKHHIARSPKSAYKDCCAFERACMAFMLRAGYASSRCRVNSDTPAN